MNSSNRYNEDAMSAYRRRSAIESGDSSGGGAELGIAAVVLVFGFLVYALLFC